MTRPLLAAMLATVALRLHGGNYQESFDNATSGNLALSSAGWLAHETHNGVLVTHSNAGISNGLGDPLAGHAKGFAFSFSYAGYAPNLMRTLFWTTEVGPLGLTCRDIASVSWKQGNQYSADPGRFAVRIGSTWYVSPAVQQAENVPSSGDFKSTASWVSIVWGAGEWRGLNFTGTPSASSTSGLSLGSVLSLPSTGDLTAVGVFFNDPSGTRRFDSFTVVPKPRSTLLLLR